MRDMLYFSPSMEKSHFQVQYPYYGLFGSAEVTAVNSNSEMTFKCKLLNGSIVILKKLLQTKKWIDMALNKETPLSSVLGNSIDDFLKSTQAV
jgi:hypothetical protein